VPLLPAQDGTAQDEDENVFELSPFAVSTEGDRGYYASNSISGSRINIALQSVPMPIEVITSEFIEDTGSQDLRESLRYSAGIILQSQNDAGVGLDGVPGGVHNGEGATANVTNTTFKIRGFVTDSSLRKGFRRQHGSDSVNIDRIEVVRGPAALLYGIGNFGGVVNYLPKRPLETQQTSITALIGSDEQYRVTLDNTGPVNDVLSYRVTGAWEDANHWTDVQNSNSWFVSPVVVLKPFENTKLTFDLELGNDETYGVGFQTMRARGDLDDLDNVIGQQGRLQKAGFVVFDDIDNRTYRLSGPDTYVMNRPSNILIEAEQHLFEGLDLMIGYNRAHVNVDTRDIVNNSYVRDQGPENLWSTINVQPFELANGDPVFDGEIFNGADEDDRVLENAVLIYMWQEQQIVRTRDEVRAELTYQLDLFEDSHWLKQSHMFLGGMSDLTAKYESKTFVSGAGAHDAFLYKDPNDHSLIRYGTGILDDGTADGVAGFKPLLQTNQNESTAGNRGYYGVWQGRFWDERITTIVGVRKDENDQRLATYTFVDGLQTDREVRTPDSQSKTTEQYGLSVEVLPGVSVFGLRSEGLEPNFDGKRDGYGNAISAKLAKSEEIGVKLNLLDGRIAATISSYKINVTGPSTLSLWWAPAPAKGRYDPNQPTVYNITDVTNQASHDDNIALYDAAVAAGNVLEQDDQVYLTVLDGSGNDTAGAAYLDAIYAWGAENGWPGWMFAGSSVTGTPANNASQDWAAGDVDWFADIVSETESEGYEVQLLFSLTDDWQLLLNYAHTERRVVDAGKFPKYPYPQDRWAIWYFPDGNWGLQGVSREEAYTDPNDTSTWTGGPSTTNGESLDDTPEHDFSFWTSYRLSEGPLEGLKFGFGGNYQSEREYLSGFTVSGDAVTDQNGNRIKLYTDPKLILNGMVRYDFEWKERPVYLQLNVDNLTNDRDLYGYVYETGTLWRLQCGMVF
jgi:outer membrane receptor protein involved in Fe transport